MKRRAIAGFKVAASLVAANSLVPPAARAFDRRDDPTACGGMPFRGSLRLKLVDGSAPWTADEKALFIDAVQRWNELRNESGNQILSAVLDPAGDITVVRGLEGTGQSNTNCSSGTPVVNIKSPAATFGLPGTLPNTSLHEAGGHARSLDHAGGQDSLMYGGQELSSGREPRMTGCGASAPHSAYPESDDFAQAIAKANGTYLPLGQYNPDSGFETYEFANTLAAGSRRSSLQLWSGLQSIVTDGTNGYAAVRNAEMRQVIRMSTPPAKFGMKYRYKTGSATNSANFKVAYRRLTYAAGASCGNAMPAPFDVDHPTYTDGVNVWATAVNKNVSGNTSWQQSPTWAAPPDPGYLFGQGLDVALAAYNLNPAAGDLYVDNFNGYMAT